ncbi:hypothetical protein VTK26DRAFT_7569 [Humicola hyalothermophila]
MAAHSVSSLFPNRPIRPLPKRRLRERLSPEVADSIQYPPLPRTAAPLFPYPYTLTEESTVDSGYSPGRQEGPQPEERQRHSPVPGADNDDSLSPRQGAASRAAQGHTSSVARAKLEQGRYTDSFPPQSATSSADGYDPFENTNNKKRKIPTAGDSVPSGAHSTNDSASRISSAASADHAGEGGGSVASSSTPYYGSGSLASGVHNIPGPGRGRYGRPRNFRNVIRPLFDSTNSWAGRTTRPRPGQWMTGSVEKGEITGIISNAIANAERLPPHQGEENISLLHQQLSAKRTQASTPFTFTCDSQVPGSASWPGSDRKTAGQPHQSSAAPQGKESWSRGSQSGQGGQTLPVMSGSLDAGSKEHAPRASTSGQDQQAPAQKSSRRSAAKEYMAAAKARRRETQLYNRRHPPKPDEIWICHFCEYEAIFGHPPEALVRQYEIKERKQRQLEQQRRAQWERMKKGKHKGKKSSKLPAKNSSMAQDAHHSVDSREVSGTHDDGTQEEEYYDDEYYEDEDYDAEDEVPLAQSSRALGSRRHDGAGHSGGSSAVYDGGGT